MTQGASDLAAIAAGSSVHNKVVLVRTTHAKPASPTRNSGHCGHGGGEIRRLRAVGLSLPSDEILGRTGLEDLGRLGAARPGGGIPPGAPISISRPAAGRQPPPARSWCLEGVLHSQVVRRFGLCYLLPATFWRVGGSRPTADRPRVGPPWAGPTAIFWRDPGPQFPGLWPSCCRPATWIFS